MHSSSSTDLAACIHETALCDTHEHLNKEHQYLDDKPDILQNLFQNYVSADFCSAGVAPEAMEGLLDAGNPDIAARFRAVEETWKVIQYTGYGEASRLTAKHLYGVDEITPGNLAAAAGKNDEIVQPGQRLHILKNLANLDHVQTDDKTVPCDPDPSGPEFFFYDLSAKAFCIGEPELEQISGDVGISVTNIAALGEAMAAQFKKHAATAIAVKSQHAYNRTLFWRERSDDEAERALQDFLKDPEGRSEESRLCLGDWCWARVCELCAEYHLPFKIHTGYYAGNDRMPVDYIRAGNMCSLLRKYPNTPFVLMHIAYPYSDELIALAKHYRGVYIDLCWAWSIDPYTSCDFVRRYIHAAPANKLFIFGGDTHFPAASLGYSIQARRGLIRVLEGEVADGLLTEKEAIHLANRLMRDNQYDCFQVEAKRDVMKSLVAAVA